MTQTKRSLSVSITSLILCFVMLIGTTFAWFTDEVTSANNIIKAGTLDISMKWSKDNATWNDAEGRNAKPVFDYDRWEPGYTEVRYIKVENLGSLAFTFRMAINPTGAIGKLAEVIDVSYDIVTDNASFVAPTAQNKQGSLKKVSTLAEIIEGTGVVANGVLLPAGTEQAGYYDGEIVICVAFHMQESAGNEYQGASIGDAFGINLYATQYNFENDSFDNSYDENAAADFFPGFQGGSASASVTLNDQGATVGEVTMDGGDVSAVIPEGVLVADGVKSLGLAVTVKNTSDSNVQLSENEKMGTLDVHIEGVAPGNTVPILVTLEGYLTTGINTGALKLYHVENGATVVMTQVANPTNHNEFSYNPATGDVTLAMASFSEVAVVADTNNPWDGKTFDYSWYLNAVAPVDYESATLYTISNADQLAGFGAIVDGTAKGIAQDSFAGKTVKLNNNIYLSGKLFDPIGWGYVNTAWNRDVDGDGTRDDGKVFQGTFDGNGKTIFDLYQDGWDLESATGTVYTYTNCGFGLFAAASNATFQNLTISGADIRVECVEAGVLVGLSQNSCTYSNIEIHNSKIANYQRPAGGLIGEVSGTGTTKITNVTIGSDVVVGSLWGDFDAPCGGVIGAYWNDVDANPQIEMSYVEVGARMDVYSDVTSAYQWYAYRRAGMLIGNTDYSEKNENGTNIASTKINGENYLTCTNVNVYYGDWANYHYAQFTNQDNDWCNNYPWVRVEAGENCSAYSNPRYGVPVVNGVKVSDMDATTLENIQDGYIERRFNQLYGGGQGVYGQFDHEGVEVINYRYSITYVNDYEVLAIKYVTESGAVDTANDVAQQLVEDWAGENIKDYNWKFGGWMNAGSTKLTSIDAGNTENIVLYPYFATPYTASFVDHFGNIISWCFFQNEEGKTNEIEPTRLSAENVLFPMLDEGFELDYWQVQYKDSNGVLQKVKYTDYNFKSSNNGRDVTVYPVYKYNGDVNLIPIDEGNDGDTDYYQVGGYGTRGQVTLVEIPESVNGINVTTINADAFSSYDDLHSVRIPSTITEIYSQAFTANQGSSWNPKRDTITMYYEGDPDDWKAEMEKYESNHNYNGMFKTNWDNMMGDGSRVFFLDENGKVINDRYWELNDDYEWVLHEHAYTYEAAKTCAHGEKSHYEYGGGVLGWGASLQEDKFTNYAGNCDKDCNTCKGGPRPDREYWIKED